MLSIIIQVGVLLIDTQGIFDNSSTTDQNSKIFTLTTLMSSIQIFNLRYQIDENLLESLEVS